MNNQLIRIGSKMDYTYSATKIFMVVGIQSLKPYSIIWETFNKVSQFLMLPCMITPDMHTTHIDWS